MPNLVALVQAQGATRLLLLSVVDALIAVHYSLITLGIGFHVKRLTKVGGDFFLAGQQPMTAVWTCAPGFGRDC